MSKFLQNKTFCRQWVARAAALMLTAAVGAGVAGCADPEAPAGKSATKPLQPLVYTERPNLSAEAAGVRERRLMRRLLEGASATGNWGDLHSSDSKPLSPARDAQSLGQAIFDALVERDEARWDAVFVAPPDYAGLVRVDLEQARKFVDDIQGRSLAVWQQFEPARPSEAPEGGLRAVLEFVDLELGQGRTVQGPIAEESEAVAQYWGNILKLKLRGTDLHFELRIQKILQIQSARGATLGLAAPVETSPQLDVFLRAGLHLKPELLETREYPYPLAVGNFWRYERSRLLPEGQQQSSERSEPDEVAHPSMALDPDGRLSEASRDAAGPAPLAATETLLEVTAVDRFGARRLVTLRRTYNDEALSSSNQYFLVLPKRIYSCSHYCRKNVKNLGRLLDYLDGETPIYRFPLSLRDSWGTGGRTVEAPKGRNSPGKGAVFSVAPEWRDVRTPAGSYTNTAVISGTGPLATVSAYYRGREQVRFFAHGHGEIQRILRDKSDDKTTAVVEKLVESRIMPR